MEQIFNNMEKLQATDTICPRDTHLHHIIFHYPKQNDCATFILSLPTGKKVLDSGLTSSSSTVKSYKSS